MQTLTLWLRSKLGGVIFGVLKAFLLGALAYQLLYPVLYMLSMSLRIPAEATDPSVVWLPKTFTLGNFIDAFKAMDFLSVMKQSAMIGLVCGVLDVASCALAGYAFARLKFRGINILFALVVFTMIVPPQTIMLPIYSQMRYFDGFGMFGLLHKIMPQFPQSINLVGNPLTMFMPAALAQGYRSGLYIFMFRQIFKQMPASLEEAAYIDGAGTFKTFTKIMLPNIKNTIITVFLFSFVWRWNEYYLTKQLMGSNRNAAVALSMLRRDITNLISVNENVNPLIILTRIQAGSLLVILPLLIIYMITQRFFTDTIENSGLK